MAPIYQVHALRAGTIHADRCESVHGAEPGTMLELPVWCAAIEGNGHKILVDTGLPDPEKWSSGNRHTLGDGEAIEAAFAELGWKTSDVDKVINTYLHHDHSGNNLAFPDARGFVSRAEWQDEAHSSNAQAWTYDLDWTEPDLTYLNYTLIDTDDYDVLFGLRVINTAEGLVCVTGDAANLMDNLTIPVQVANFVSPTDALVSIRKICDRSDRVLINHEPSLTRFQSAGFPLTPKHGPVD